MGETETNFSTKDFKRLSPAIDNYTERQYNNYGWIAVNNVMSYEEYGSLMHQFDDFKNRKYQYPVTKNGEALIITYDGNHNATKIVAIKGTTANPIITLVIKPVYGGYFDEYYLEVIRQNEALFKNITALRVLEGEELFTIKSKQNYSSFSELKRQRRSFEKSGRDSESFLYGNGSGSEDTESEYLNNEPSSNDGGFSMPKFSTKDSEYMKAAESGDTETAQRMVDEAAKEAGYSELMYHGSKSSDNIKVFRDWQYFTENEAYAQRYAGKKLYKSYVKINNLFDTRNKKELKIFNEARREYGLSEIGQRGLPDWTDGYDLSEFIDENGLDYDAIILDEGGDMVNGKPVYRGNSYVVRKSNQIKSADPVTYDDNGDIIPLSERFNENEEDIRYSVKDDIVDEDGNHYGKGVYLDSNFFDGLSDKEKEDLLRDLVENMVGDKYTLTLANGKKFSFVVKDSEKKFFNGKKNVSVNRDIKTNFSKSNIKQQGIALFNELLNTAVMVSPSRSTHSHGWVDNFGNNDWNYLETIVQEKNNTVKKAVLHFAKAQNGENILYDISFVDPIKRAMGTVYPSSSLLAMIIP